MRGADRIANMLLDIIGGLLWILVFVSPLIVFPLVFRYLKVGWGRKLLVAVLMSIVIASVFWGFSLRAYLSQWNRALSWELVLSPISLTTKSFYLLALI